MLAQPKAHEPHAFLELCEGFLFRRWRAHGPSLIKPSYQLSDLPCIHRVFPPAFSTCSRIVFKIPIPGHQILISPVHFHNRNQRTKTTLKEQKFKKFMKPKMSTFLQLPWGKLQNPWIHANTWAQMRKTLFSQWNLWNRTSAEAGELITSTGSLFCSKLSWC